MTVKNYLENNELYPASNTLNLEFIKISFGPHVRSTKSKILAAESVNVYFGHPLGLFRPEVLT